MALTLRSTDLRARAVLPHGSGLAQAYCLRITNTVLWWGRRVAQASREARADNSPGDYFSGSGGGNAPHKRPPLYFPQKPPYIGGVTQVTIAINALWNKRIGPGGRTRRLHQNFGVPSCARSDDRASREPAKLPLMASSAERAGGKLRNLWGRVSFDNRGKGLVFARRDLPWSVIYTCQR